jgi:hypothetical protein
MNGFSAGRAAVAVAISAFMLSGCVTRSAGPGRSDPPVKIQESIAYEVGPCFGFCPVYNAAIASNGRVSFEGIRHTVTLGSKTVEAGASVYRDFAQALAPFRPPAGASATTTCDARISDQQHYRIVWTAADGTKSVLEHDRGCRSPRNDALNSILESAPERLGLASIAKQITRPGASRG